jgi:uncharacterized membrane protein YeaQ/YmgE (transglycosylase-associated protein family)
MEFSFTIGMWAVIALMVGSVVLGVAIQMFGNPGFGYEWLITAIGAVIGGFVASEFIVGFRTWEPLFDGMAIIPALVGAIVVGGVMAIAVRWLTAGTRSSGASA